MPPDAFLVALDALARPWYEVPPRVYHDWPHIEEMRAFARDHGIAVSRLQHIAIAFHDAVYVPFDAANERLSANIGEAAARALGLPAQDAERVRTAILDTQTHAPAIPESELVIALDLVRLAADDFPHWLRALHEEHAARFDSFEAYRSAWIEHVGAKFLARSRIYPDERVAALLEERARANLARLSRQAKRGGYDDQM